ncbi:MAG TPA: hypothetical protein VK961_20830 [Chthoniobacter sp.]|nr:hypothetical protein [Chthoniobacter sp.]
MKRLFLFLLLFGASLVHGEEPSATTFLKARPVAPSVEVRQWLGATGFILWTPKLTLAQAIDAAGGFQKHNDYIEIQHLASHPAPDQFLSKNQLIQNPKIQKQTFAPGDRITITRLLKPY